MLALRFTGKTRQLTDPSWASGLASSEKTDYAPPLAFAPAGG
ncbi:hypothetical protein [Methylobacterium sp. J-048]|nr:hypothetical protein [Methylobacterium sp. J-048]